MTLFGIFILLLGTAISIIITYFVIRTAVFDGMRDAIKSLDPGRNYLKSIIKDAIKESKEEQE
ncbi:MAG: hypothetical protein FWB80_02615 [Defluviitaleaceae bacterium]|nr:hypothetical protein [Defluviitaleaceae bacterium]